MDDSGAWFATCVLDSMSFVSQHYCPCPPSLLLLFFFPSKKECCVSSLSQWEATPSSTTLPPSLTSPVSCFFFFFSQFISAACFLYNIFIPVIRFVVAVVCSSNKRKEEPATPAAPPEQPSPKKPRLVFTDLQRRTLQAIFKVSFPQFLKKKKPVVNLANFSTHYGSMQTPHAIYRRLLETVSNITFSGKLNGTFFSG